MSTTSSEPSFFFGVHNDLFEEVAKFRAARRIWASLVRERFGAADPDAAKLRFHSQTDGATLTAQQPLNNVVRVTLQALAAVLGGTQSLHTNGYDEALALPTEESAQLALRTQQILAHESGVADTADPLGGSYLVERLTADLEERIRDYLDRIEDMGGAIAAIESQFFRSEIEREAYAQQRRVESGEEVVVGVNRWQREEEAEPRIPRVAAAALAAQQVARLEEWRERRNSVLTDESLERLSGCLAVTPTSCRPSERLVKPSDGRGDRRHAAGWSLERTAILREQGVENDQSLRCPPSETLRRTFQYASGLLSRTP